MSASDPKRTLDTGTSTKSLATAAEVTLKRNPTSCGHEIHRAGRNLERIPLAIAMHNSSIKEIGDRRKPDVRVGPHIEPMSRKKLRRPHLIEEDEGANHLALVAPQGAADFKAIA